jgi:hypothetical protein
MDQSLFARLSKAHKGALAELTSQYRMNKHIMSLCFKKKELTDQFETVMKEMAVDRYLFQK